MVVASRDRRAGLLGSLPRHLALPERPPVVLVDNGSNDGTVPAVRAAHPEVEIVEAGDNLGAVARTLGARAARTPYVAFTDDDAWWRPGALALAADLLDAHEDLALVQARVLVGPEGALDPVCAEMGSSPLRGRAPGHPILSFVACAVVVRRDAFLAVGGFPEGFGIGGEEELVGWGLVAAGWRLAYVPDVVGHHHPPPAPGGRPRRRSVQLRNALWSAWLRRPAGAAVRRTAHQLRAAPADRHTVRGLAEAVAGLPWVLRERRVDPPDVERMRRALERS